MKGYVLVLLGCAICAGGGGIIGYGTAKRDIAIARQDTQITQEVWSDQLESSMLASYARETRQHQEYETMLRYAIEQHCEGGIPSDASAADIAEAILDTTLPE